MDKAKILLQCNEIERAVNELYVKRQDSITRDERIAFINMLGVIVAEITAPPKSNGDRIRAMTDEELGFWKACPDCESCAWRENRECDNDCTKYNCFNGVIEWLRKEVSEDADNSGS